MHGLKREPAAPEPRPPGVCRGAALAEMNRVCWDPASTSTAVGLVSFWASVPPPPHCLPPQPPQPFGDIPKECWCVTRSSATPAVVPHASRRPRGVQISPGLPGARAGLQRRPGHVCTGGHVGSASLSSSALQGTGTLQAHWCAQRLATTVLRASRKALPGPAGRG